MRIIKKCYAISNVSKNTSKVGKSDKRNTTLVSANIIYSKSTKPSPEKGNWTNAHLSPNKLSGSSIGKGLSKARSGLDPF